MGEKSQTKPAKNSECQKKKAGRKVLSPQDSLFFPLSVSSIPLNVIAHHVDMQNFISADIFHLLKHYLKTILLKIQDANKR